MTEKPDLIVKLFAGDTLVDQSTDVGLWQRVLSEIRNIPPPQPDDAKGDKGNQGEREREKPKGGGTDALSKFAADLEITTDDVRGGLDPQTEVPFISLDGRSWEALKKNTPPRGPHAVTASVLAATALVLWQKRSGIADITLDMVRATLSTIELEDKNLNRSLDNCDWLQVKGSRVVLHPSNLSSGVRVLKAYCLRKAPTSEA